MGRFIFSCVTILLIAAFVGPVAATADLSLKKTESATRSMLFFDLYELTVYDPDGQLTRTDIRSADVPKRLELEVLAATCPTCRRAGATSWSRR